MKLRIKFRKYGVMKYIGHLDILRYFQKVIRRSGIDVAYSKGYSPHQIMSFAAPLGVGLESNGEYMDIETNSITTSKDMIQRLNEANVDGIEILSVKLLPDSAGNAMASVAAAAYTLTFKEGKKPAFDYIGKLSNFYNNDSLPFEKETKRGSAVIDLKPAIYQLEVRNEDSIYMLVNASSSGNIKPTMVMDAYFAFHNETPEEHSLQITREEIYINIGTEEKMNLVPMDAIGEDF